MFMYRQKSSEIDTFTHIALVLFDIRVLIVLLFSTSQKFFVIQYSVAKWCWSLDTVYTVPPEVVQGFRSWWGTNFYFHVYEKWIYNNPMLLQAIQPWVCDLARSCPWPSSGTLNKSHPCAPPKIAYHCNDLELALRRRNSEFVEVYLINALWSEHSKFCSRTMHVTTVAHHSFVITWQRDAQEARWTMYYKRYHHPHKFRLHSRTCQDKLSLNWRLLSLSFFFYRPAEIDWLIW